MEKTDLYTCLFLKVGKLPFCKGFPVYPCLGLNSVTDSLKKMVVCTRLCSESWEHLVHVVGQIFSQVPFIDHLLSMLLFFSFSIALSEIFSFYLINLILLR